MANSNKNSVRLLTFWQTKEEKEEEKAEFFRDISRSARTLTIGSPENPLTRDDVKTISREIYNTVLDSMNGMQNFIFPVSSMPLVFLHPNQAEEFREQGLLEDN